ncbi:hypothetical protein LOD99_15899 [Oopsacas minuta]|uniref:Uncharacterized protein n=1 Tax=Oopsacas minuta TaxID=111878 RepID=A0AAV7K8M9_9METZ|nr:hypothetical protein LOD99_15899 [Oopsacas minuta]
MKMCIRCFKLNEKRLTRSMNDNDDDAIFAAIREEFISPQLILGNCYFHLAHRSKSLKATWKLPTYTESTIGLKLWANKYSNTYPNSMKSFLSEYGPPNKDGWLRVKLVPVSQLIIILKKNFPPIKKTLMQTTPGDILYLKEAIKFISFQSKLESRSLPSHPLDLDCDPPKHVLSRIRGFFQRAFEMLASKESLAQLLAEKDILMERLYHSKSKYCYLLEKAMYHTHQQNIHYMDVHQIQTSWTEVTAQRQEVDEVIWRLDSLQQKIDSSYYPY